MELKDEARRATSSTRKHHNQDMVRGLTILYMCVYSIKFIEFINIYLKQSQGKGGLLLDSNNAPDKVGKPCVF